jgi:hypothetical protein
VLFLEFFCCCGGGVARLGEIGKGGDGMRHGGF